MSEKFTYASNNAEIDAIFIRGHEDYCAGYDKPQNPYLPELQEYDAYEEGWSWARMIADTDGNVLGD
jgi:hypothetical protein